MEPVYKWEPITDEYKSQSETKATSEADIEAENRQKLEEFYATATRQKWVEKKAPIGIRVFTWYLFCRAGFYALLLAILGVFPQSAPSNWMVANLGHFMRIPGQAQREEAARERAAMRAAGIDPDSMQQAGGDANAGDASAEKSPDQMQRESIMIYLFILAAATTVVGFMWWNHSWKVRWVAMFYAGGMVAKTGVGLFAGWASGAGVRMPPAAMQTLTVAMGVNLLIFCYLAFWPGVTEWFEEQS